MRRSAIEAGRVAVEIDRKFVVGGSGAGGQPSARPFPLTNRLASASPVAALPLDKALPSWATPSDVSADELMSYLQSVIAGTGSGLASDAPQLANSLGAATPLGDAEAFDYAENLPDIDPEQIAGMPFNGAPGSWASSMPGTMRQLRQYGPNGTPMTDIDFEAHHGNPNPHAHNWDGTNRDEGAPVSILPW